MDIEQVVHEADALLRAGRKKAAGAKLAAAVQWMNSRGVLMGCGQPAEDPDAMCVGCVCWKHHRAMCS
jgi:hypothetical protein